MGYDVSSWFLSQLEQRNSKPVRKFLIGTSDYSSRVEKYPRFKRTANNIKSINVNVDLSNEDGKFNNFYHYTYTIPNTCTLKVGFTHPTSGDELVTLYTGFLKDVAYPDKKRCTLKLRDRLWDFSERKVGDSDVPVDIGSTIPSDIAWSLCTCYGGLSSVASTSNPDIEYADFLVWAGQFSADSVLMSAHYEGKKVVDALSRLGKMTDSAIWIEGNGKLMFKKFIEPSSLDVTFTDEYYLDLGIDVESLRLINRHFTYFDYSVESNFWTKTVFSQESISVNSFGLKEGITQDETIWHVDSIGALTLSQRKVNLLKDPPKKFDLSSGLYGINRQLGETIRLVDSFFGITSASGWRLVEAEYDMDGTKTMFNLDEATVMNGFYLDVSDLDGDDLLL